MRTAVCPVCGAKRLKWAQNALGMRYLVDFETGAVHYKTCPGVKAEGDGARDFQPEPSERDDNRPSDQPEPSEGDGAEPEPEQDESGDGDQEREGEQDESEDSSESQDEPSEPDRASDDNPARDMPPAEGEDTETDSAEPETEDEPEGDGEEASDESGEEGERDEPKAPEDQPEPERKPESEPEHHDHRLQPVLNRWVKLGLNVMTVGPAGGGKTTAARNAAESCGMRYFEQSMGPQTSQWDLVGYNGPDGEYHPGFLYAPFKFGGLAMLDEVDAGNPGILVVLNSMMANGHYSFPNGEEVVRHPDFRIVAGANTYGRGADRLYVGRNQLDAATLDRFAVLDWDYDESVEARWAGGDIVATRWVAYVQRVRRVAFDLKMRFVVSPRASIYGARMLRAGIDRAECEEAILWKGLSRDERVKFAHLER